MSTRPRIRSVKPEIWQDEKIGRLTRDARLLFIGLITLADDDGRFRALPSMILGHCFPYDQDAHRKLVGWMDELIGQELVLVYSHDGMPYGQIPNWSSHQRINRKTDSVLPEPGVNGSRLLHQSFTELSVKAA